MASAPRSVTLFSYQVGFGDCFLLRFDYADRPRHVLIDFGSMKLPDGAESGHMVRVAEDIAAKCGGKLDVLVATHRHADHVSGFATNRDGDAPGDIIRRLDPDLVLQPWTEAPDADDASLGPAVSSPYRSLRQKLAALEAMHGVAELAVKMLDDGALDRSPPAVRDQIDFIGRDNIRNLSAVENLMTMGRERRYLFHGCDAGLEALLPGVTTVVLGPPTLAQTETIRRQRSKDPDEFWHLSLMGLQDDAGLGTEAEARLFPDHPVFPANRLPMEVIWLRDRLDEARTAQLLSIVRSLDRQMNNTSLILLFRIGGKRLLFPGDAQLENWEYALQSDLAAELDDVDLYKVGHHGSLNATPRSLWNRFSKKGADNRPDRLRSVLSTMPGKHGHEEDRTEVPRRTLLEALDAGSELHSTHLLPEGALYQEVTILVE